MPNLFESFGSFNSGKPPYRLLISKKSKGNLSLNETFLSFESHADKILFQIKLSDIQDVAIKNRFKISLIELQVTHGSFYTIYPLIKKDKSSSPSKGMTLELFRQIIRLVFNKDQTIFFNAIGGLYIGTLSCHELKEPTFQGYIFLTENYILFKSFQPSHLYKINVLDFKDITLELADSTTYVKIETIHGHMYSFFPLKRHWRKFKEDRLNPEKFYDILNQAKMYKESELIRLKKEKKEKTEKIKIMLQVSDRLRLEALKNILELDKESFNEKIYEWAKEFNFTIDGDYIIINKETIPAFLGHLEEPANLVQIDTNVRKIKCSACGNMININLEFCPYCGNKNVNI
ncbi:MAG: hypothetical protein ACFFDB_13350 [Promethearchaeota archaeon]